MFEPESNSYSQQQRHSGKSGGKSSEKASGNSLPEKVGGRSVPCDLAAERSILGAALLNNEIIDRVVDEGLTANDFYREAHRVLFQAACDLFERKEAVDPITLRSLLKDRGQFETVGGFEFISGLFEDQFALGNASHYAKIVRQKAILRRMVQVCGDLLDEALSGVEDVDDFVHRAEKSIMEASQSFDTKSFSDLRSIILENIQSIENLALNNKDVTGLSTGFERFDRLTTGLHGGQVMILAARPGMGKTSWFISVLQHSALGDGAVVALFSLEMTKEEMGFRFISAHSRVDSKALRTGKIQDRDWRKVTDSAAKLAKSKIFIDDSGGTSLADVRSKCRRLKQQQKRLDLIVIDYLQLMTKSKSSKGGDASSREREVSEISRGLKELAKELKVPIIVCAQLNRLVENRPDKRPVLSDLRESGSIEQDADLVCFIYRDEYYYKEKSEDPGVAELIVGKNRSGPTETVRLAWLGQYTLFENLTENAPGGPVR